MDLKFETLERVTAIRQSIYKTIGMYEYSDILSQNFMNRLFEWGAAITDLLFELENDDDVED